MADPDLDERARRGGRSAVLLWGSSIVLAAAATGVVVFSDDPRFLRLGVVAALWVALVAAFAVVKLRDRASETDENAAELHRAYERELEREIAARREHEVEVETEARRKAAEDKQTEIDQLHTELRQLRENLEQLVGGDLLFERVALRAESTRVRSLTEGGRQSLHNAVIQTPEQRPQQLAAGPVHDGQTDLISPVPPEPHVAPRSVSHETPSPRPRAVPSQQRYKRPHLQDQASSHDLPGAQEQPARGFQRPGFRDPRGAQQPVTYESAESAGEAATPEHPGRSIAAREAAGAHTEGTSVKDLLAAYGNNADSRRSRRRRD